MGKDRCVGLGEFLCMKLDALVDKWHRKFFHGIKMSESGGILINDGLIEARDIVFEHIHPIFGKSKMDKTYLEQNSQANHAKGLAAQG